MKIFGMCLVKNEIDIVRQSLCAAVQWCDAIYVFDNGSDDGTWQEVLDISRKERAVVPFKCDPKPFVNSLRAEIFDQYKTDARVEDWWCRLDADEFYIDDPRTFLAGIEDGHDIVWSASFQYYFTDQDAARYHRNPEAFSDGVPVQEKVSYYLNNWSEPRFFRHGCTLTDCMGGRRSPQSSRNRIRLKHFQYRSPGQIVKRIANRREPMARGLFAHELLSNWSTHVLRPKDSFRGRIDRPRATDWEDRVVDSGALIFDNHSGDYQIQEERLPRISDCLGAAFVADFRTEGTAGASQRVR